MTFHISVVKCERSWRGQSDELKYITDILAEIGEGFIRLINQVKIKDFDVVRRRALLFSFFLSGGASLIYEVVWARRLILVFGNTTFASATILAAFMGGLALGSYIFGRVAKRPAKVLWLYGLLEIGIGLFALFFPSIANIIESVYIRAFEGAEPHYMTLGLLQFGILFSVLLFPTALMGGTLPILGKYFVREAKAFGREAGLLYGLNTLGGVIGTVLAGFFLVRLVGMSVTNTLAAIVSLSVGILILFLARGEKPREPRKKLPLPDGASGPSLRRSFLVLLLVAYGFSGFTALGYEVVFTRALLPFTGMHSYAFASILGIFLAGIALGSLLYALFLNKRRDLVRLFAALA